MQITQRSGITQGNVGAARTASYSPVVAVSEPTSTVPMVVRRPANRTPLGEGSAQPFNRRFSALQLAADYLGQVHAQLHGLLFELRAPPAFADVEAVAEHVKQLALLLEQRAVRSGQSLDAAFQLCLDSVPHSRLSFLGLPTLASVQNGGPEVLLFSAGRHLSGPLAVVFGEPMEAAQALRRLSASLGPLGLQAVLDRENGLVFRLAEAAWQRLKGTLRVQGEGARFPAGDFQPLQVLELGLFADLPAAYGGTRAERGTLLALVNNAVATVAGSLIDVEQRQRDLREQLTGQESAAERSWAWTFSSVLQGRSGADYARLSEAVLAQANLSRSAIVGLLG